MSRYVTTLGNLLPLCAEQLLADPAAGLRILSDNADDTVASALRSFLPTLCFRQNVLLPQQESVNALGWHPDGKHLAVAGVDTVFLWDVETRRLVWKLVRPGSSFFSVQFSADGSRIVTASCADCSASVWDVATGDCVQRFVGHYWGVYSAAFNHDGTRVVTASCDGTACIWDVATGMLLHILQKSDVSDCQSARFNRDGAYVVTAHDKHAVVWDVRSGDLLYTLSWPAAMIGDSQGSTLPVDHTAQVTVASFSNDGTKILTASFDRTVRLWDMATKRLLALAAYPAPVLSAQFSHDDSQIILAFGEYVLWVDSATLCSSNNLLVGHTASVSSIRLSPDGRLLASGSHDKTVVLWALSLPAVSDVRQWLLIRLVQMARQQGRAVDLTAQENLFLMPVYQALDPAWRTLIAADVRVPQSDALAVINNRAL